jgi:hypothetical protein
MPSEGRGILSPVRLPVPPLQQVVCLFEFTRYCGRRLKSKLQSLSAYCFTCRNLAAGSCFRRLNGREFVRRVAAVTLIGDVVAIENRARFVAADFLGYTSLLTHPPTPFHCADTGAREIAKSAALSLAYS